MTERRRRIVRRAVMVLAVVVLIPGGYVGSVISASFAVGAGCIPSGMMPTLHAVYSPLTWYDNNQYPGSRAIEWASMEAEELGERVANR